MSETVSPKPVRPRGGSRLSEAEILSRTFALMQQGAPGTVYGRNVCQHPHIERIVRAYKAIVHEGASVSQAMSILNESRTRAKQNAFAPARA